MSELRLHQVHQEFPGTPPVQALRGVSLTIKHGEFVAIVGPSGSGKSTLLNDLALLHIPTQGDYFIDDNSVVTASESRRAAFRSQLFGFVFQSFHLLDSRPVIDSVTLGMFYRAIPHKQRLARAQAALRAVGLENRAHERAAKLSGGERQRVAIARAMAVDAPIVLADEPTGNLDSTNGRAVVDSLSELAAQGRTVVLVTHDEAVASRAHRRIVLRDGVIDSDTSQPGNQPKTSQIPHPVGKDSRVLLPDLLRDAWASVISRPGKTATLVSAVAVAVALGITTLGLSQSASAQVSSRFDAVRQTRVTAVVQGNLPPDPFAPNSAVESISQMSGVRSVGAVHQYDDTAHVAGVDTAELPIFTVEGSLVDAITLTIDPVTMPDFTLQSGEVLVGQLAADELGLGPMTIEPTVTINSRPVVVVGIITESSRSPELLSGIVISHKNANLAPGQAIKVSYLVNTLPGAAEGISHQLPLLLRPTAPTEVDVSAPPKIDSMRATIESDVKSTLYILTGVAILASLIGLTNSMMLWVIERSKEFGLRRAIGARVRHVVAQVLCESTIIGVAGGILGLTVGISAILTVTVAQRWQPVFDLQLAPVALIAGIAVGALSGTFSAIRAARIQPADALRA